MGALSHLDQGASRDRQPSDALRWQRLPALSLANRPADRQIRPISLQITSISGIVGQVIHGGENLTNLAIRENYCAPSVIDVAQIYPRYLGIPKNQSLRTRAIAIRDRSACSASRMRAILTDFGNADFGSGFCGDSFGSP